MRVIVILAAAALVACSTKSTSVDSTGGGGSGADGGSAGSGGGDVLCVADESDPDEMVATSAADPAGGAFTLEQALEGLPPGDGPLRAVITTDVGEITCTFDERPTNAVANFIGLARGVRPWRHPTTGAWVKRRYYDGLLFHRIIDDFMAQGGDPLGTGTGGPGYQLTDEIFPELLFTPGTLAYANSGPNSSGSQFFITEIATDWLDGTFVIIAQCEPMSVIEVLTAVETDGDPMDGGSNRPLVDTHIQRVDITRCAE